MTRLSHPERSEGPLANASRRTLLLTLEYPPMRGGIASYLAALHQDMPTVVAHLPRSRFFLWPHWLSMITEAWKIARHNSCSQIAISHVLPMGYVTLTLWWFIKMPFFVFVHGLDLSRAARSPWKRFWLRQILHSANHVIANSEFTKQLALKYGAKPESTSVILPCVNINVIARTQSEAKGTKQSRPSTDKHLLLSISRLVPRKNHKLVLEALARFRTEFPLLRYVVVGDGPLKDSLIFYSRELEIGDLVEWRGSVTDEERAELYRNADIFVLPTKCEGDDIEGFGIVFLEAASYGIPVIAGRGGGVDEAVIDEETGLLIDSTSIQELVDALRRLLRDQTYAQKLGAAARERVERDFRCEDRQKQLMDIYQGIPSPSRGPNDEGVNCFTPDIVRAGFPMSNESRQKIVGMSETGKPRRDPRVPREGNLGKVKVALMPQISIVIPAYNAEKTIQQCLESIFAQTFQDFEIIVVNDGSTDRTAQVVVEVEPRVRETRGSTSISRLINQENRGSNPARNRGLREARGEYLLFLDADMTMERTALQKLFDVLQVHTDASYAYCSFRHGHKLFRLWPFDPKRLRRMPYISTFALVRRVDFPGFDEQIRRLQDWDVWLTMLENGKRGVWMPEVLMYAKTPKNGISYLMPKWFFWIPWRYLPWQPPRIRKYLEAVEIIKKKHHLNSSP